jgi:hypothetical protein
MNPGETRLGDRVDIGDLTKVHKTLAAMHQHFRNTCQWITEHVQRTDRTLALFNLLSATSDYLHVAGHNLQTHASVLALATRSLYELNLRTRHLLASGDNVRFWQAEAPRDKIEVLEGILRLQTGGETEHERAILRDEIDRLKGLAAKYKLPPLERIPSTAAIAESVGRSDEHKALFKLFSKIVHPSSYLVNDYRNAASGQVSIILQVHAQLYAWDTFNRICDVFGVPEKLRVLPDEGT